MDENSLICVLKEKKCTFSIAEDFSASLFHGTVNNYFQWLVLSRMLLYIFIENHIVQ